MLKKVCSWKGLYLLAIAGLVVMAWVGQASAKGGCPRDIQCPDIYDPVTCDFGVVYPNACYAYADPLCNPIGV